MLDVTIYKVKHGGSTERKAEAEARKLIPYIKQSDVFSLELTGYSKEQAVVSANFWNSLLTNPSMSRTNLRSIVDQNLGGIRLDQKHYMLSLCDYLFRNKVGLWFAEQSPTREEGIESNNLVGRAQKEWFNAVESAARKELGAQEKIYKACGCLGAMQDSRDKTIASVVQSSESQIREVYPWLSSKETIRMGIQIGSFHEPEKYIRNAKVVPLFGPDTKEIELFRKLRKRVAAGESLEDAACLINELVMASQR